MKKMILIPILAVLAVLFQGRFDMELTTGSLFLTVAMLELCMLFFGGQIAIHGRHMARQRYYLRLAFNG